MCVYNSSLPGHFKASLFQASLLAFPKLWTERVDANGDITWVCTGDIWRMPWLCVRGDPSLQALVGVGSGKGRGHPQVGQQTWSTAGMGPRWMKVFGGRGALEGEAEPWDNLFGCDSKKWTLAGMEGSGSVVTQAQLCSLLVCHTPTPPTSAATQRRDSLTVSFYYFCPPARVL